jgi:hypothetical protein
VGTAYDPVRRRIIFYAGLTASGAGTNETYVLALRYGTWWLALTPFGAVPPTSAGAAVVYDPGKDRLVKFGGDGTSGASALYFADGYALDVASDAPVVFATTTRNPSRSCYPASETVTLSATPPSGYRFWRWLGDVAGNANPTTIVMDGNKTVLAQFVHNTTGVSDEPLAFELSRVFPNPTEGATRVDFALAFETRVTVTVHDVMGREVARLVDAVRPAGHYSVAWQGPGRGTRSAGVYFVRYHAAGHTAVRKLALMP